MYNFDADRMYDYNNQFNRFYGIASLDENIRVFGYFGDLYQDRDFWLMYDAGGEL